MKYKRFIIHRYKGIKKDVVVDLDTGEQLLALIGLNECGKSSILKAMLAFDYENDKRYEQEKHLKDLVNYYQTELPAELKVSAEIRLENDENFKTELFSLIKSYNYFDEFGVIKPTQTNENGETIVLDVDENSESFVKQYNSFLSKDVIITRVYNENNPSEYIYSIEHEKLNALSNEFAQHLCKLIIKYLPICNYLHSRTDIEEEIEVTESNKNNYWNVIFNNLFIQSINKTLLEVINEPNRNIRNQNLNVIKFYLSNQFSNAWKELGRDENFTEDINFELQIENNKLVISLNEQIKGNQSSQSFKIVNRSDGFQWYYSFIMQLLFNPFVKGEYNKSVLFLLDEPGMYLNPVAQISLLKRFNEITKLNKNTQIIYTTHSHHMLNSQYLNPYQVCIVEKDKNDLIQLYNFKNYPKKGTRLSALSPLFDSLQIPFDERVIGNKKVVLVEGIHDFYALSLFGDFGNDYYIYPCAGATTIEKNIAFFIMLKTDYAYLVDNDKEGIEKAMHSIEDHYEKNRGVFLPFDGYKKIEDGSIVPNGKFEMDNIFSDVLSEWSSELGFVNATYQRLIEYMYHNKNKTKVKTLLNNENIKLKFQKIKAKILEIL